MSMSRFSRGVSLSVALAACGSEDKSETSGDCPDGSTSTESGGCGEVDSDTIEDTSTDDSGGTTDIEPLIQAVSYDWTNTTVIWSMDTSGGAVGTVLLDLAETGDTSGSCVAHPNCSDEGFWTEAHEGFDLVSSDGDLETFEIHLEVVPTYEEYQQNATTLLDMAQVSIESNVTFMVNVTDSAGNWVSCLAGGHDPSYFGTCQ